MAGVNELLFVTAQDSTVGLALTFAGDDTHVTHSSVCGQLSVVFPYRAKANAAPAILTPLKPVLLGTRNHHTLVQIFICRKSERISSRTSSHLQSKRHWLHC